MVLRQVKGDTYIIDTGFQVIPFFKLDMGKIIMVDCGLLDEREGIVNLLASEGLKPSAILATHAHTDHIENAAFFQKEFGAPIIMTEVEAAVLDSPLGLKTYFYTMSVSDIMKHYNNMVVKAYTKIGMHDENIDILGAGFRIIMTPGHSPGHISVVTPDNVACIGDALASLDVLNSSKMMFSHTISRDIESKRNLFELEADKYVVSHKGVFDEIRSLIQPNIDYLEASANVILDLIEVPMAFEELFERVTRHHGIRVRDLKRYYMMERMMRPLIEYLVDTGKLRCSVDAGRLYYIK